MDINNTRLVKINNINPGLGTNKVYELLSKVYLQYLKDHKANYKPHPEKYPTIPIDNNHQRSFN